MYRWFTSRLKNSREWFRIAYPASRLEGYKHQDGTLYVSLIESGKEYRIAIDRNSATQLSQWIQRTYPARNSNVIPINSKHPPKFSVITPSQEIPKD